MQLSRAYQLIGSDQGRISKIFKGEGGWEIDFLSYIKMRRKKYPPPPPATN